MTATTQELLGDASIRRRSVWLTRFAEIHQRLRDTYGVPSLGNFDSPTLEILYIVLSAKTTEALYQEASRRLLDRFPQPADIAGADLGSLLECIQVAGLAAVRRITRAPYPRCCKPART